MRIRLYILLLASLLQVYQLAQDIRFHPDEAYFMTFARHAAVNGDWMLSGSLDKPPLSIYVSAISMIFVGNTTDANGVLHLDALNGEFAGRLPNVFFAILLVAVMMRLADDLYHDQVTTVLVGIFAATSPYIMAFGATAFTDMSLLFWLVLALWLALRRKWGWAGVALALAFWSKQQALFYVPLILAVSYMVDRLHRRKLTRVAIGIILFLMLFLWDAARPETSIFLLGTLNNTPDTLLADPSLYGNRLWIWIYFGSWLIGHPVWTFIVLFITSLGWGWRWLHRDAYWRWDILWIVFIVGYISLHTLIAFNQYDRYLLPILPLLILFCARGTAAFLWFAVKRGADEGGIVLLCLASVVGSLYVGIPVGGDKGDYHGIDVLADYLNSKPIATVIYDRWLGWELGYYMGQWTNKRRVHYPTPQALVKGALELDEIGDRYLVAPIDQPIQAWLDALEDAGFTIMPDYEADNFRVYRLLVPASDA